MQLSNKFLVAVLVVVGLSLYALSFGNAMFWDDDDFILHNQYIQDTQYLPKLFSENVIAGSGLVSNYWRPVLLMVFSAEWHAWGNWTVGWHAVNSLFHVANGVLVFYFLLTLLCSVPIHGRSDNGVNHSNQEPINRHATWFSFVVALIFLIHPVQVEAVAYVNSLGDSLSVFFMLSAVCAYQHYRVGGRGLWYLAALLLYPLGLMSKETAIVLPMLLVLVDIGSSNLFPLSVRRGWHVTKQALLHTAPFFVVAGAYVAARITILNFKNSLNLYEQANAYSESVWYRLLTFFKVLWEYLQLLLWPRVLHMERSMETATSLWNAQVLLGVVVLVGLLALAVWGVRRRIVLPAFGVLWFLIALAPTSNILVPINGVLYEHWLYVPLIGFAVALCSVPIYRPLKRQPINGHATRIALVVVMLMLIALVVRSGLRIAEWRDPVVFYKQTLSHAQGSYRILNNLGMELADRGDLKESISYYNRAITQDTGNPVAYHNLANTYVGLGNLALAIQYYEQALKQDPKFLYTYGKLIQVYGLAGEWDLALGVLDRYEAQVGKSKETEQARNALARERELGKIR